MSEREPNDREREPTDPGREPTDPERADEGPEKLADELEHDAREMDERSAGVENEIDKTRKDWEAKRRDPSEPGAVPPEGDQGIDAGPAPDAS